MALNTNIKENFFNRDKLKDLGVVVDRKGKLPDVVLYWPEKNWLLLIESVTSHGPVDGKRYGELSKLFANATPGLVFVTAFPDKRIMTRYLEDISWVDTTSAGFCVDDFKDDIAFATALRIQLLTIVTMR